MIYLTRHGRSMTNEDRDLKSPFKIGVKNNVLTREGVDQALEYGAWLRGLSDEIGSEVCNVIVSPYARTKQTAYLIATQLDTMVPIHYDRNFREIDWKINGRWNRLLDAQYPDLSTKKMDIDLKPLIDHRRRAFSLESPREVYQRVVPRFIRAVERYGERGDLLLVSHYFVVRSLQAFVEHGTADAMMDYDPRNLCKVSWTNEQVLERIARHRAELGRND